MENTKGIPVYSETGAFKGYECPVCFNKAGYSTRWDSFVCETCEEWMDNESKHPDSPYFGRPEKPEFFDTPFGKGVV